MKDIQCKELIISSLLTRGEGVDYSPIRRITQVYDKDGNLIAERDPLPDNNQEIFAFCEWVRKKGYDISKVDMHLIQNWKKELFRSNNNS